jgi:hypothetical protein
MSSTLEQYIIDKTPTSSGGGGVSNFDALYDKDNIYRQYYNDDSKAALIYPYKFTYQASSGTISCVHSGSTTINSTFPRENSTDKYKYVAGSYVELVVKFKDTLIEMFNESFAGTFVSGFGSEYGALKGVEVLNADNFIFRFEFLNGALSQITTSSEFKINVSTTSDLYKYLGLDATNGVVGS